MITGLCRFHVIPTEACKFDVFLQVTTVLDTVPPDGKNMRFNSVLDTVPPDGKKHAI
jgi:hypothetical protein